MSRLFISHSSKDNFEAIAFRDWLIREGWNERSVAYPCGATSSTLMATTSQQLAIDRQVKHDKIARAPFDLEPRSYRPDSFGERGGLAPMSLSLFQGTQGDF
jgi:hypothetical protein